MKYSSNLIQLNPHDNVLVARKELAKGERIAVSGEDIEIIQDVELGFKLAAKNIYKGEKIIKYGIPIGSATVDILCGQIVHVENMKSDYSQTYTIENQSDYEGN